ncbi:DUF3841 domain-containing protein [Cupriavidus sp. CV2]|uniref:DUF3841 domain-containing protein n=1 Tax=Cupriavidus ulmosensis TaxID=3065913 RepID=UPI00296ABEAF|nr:DUF3841 domain-containing protein [Cupriavidus sp. CV2]MDW3680603.1 DUF3841 domain-containing protein [Cupriavidus sp. CV2]
MRLYTIQPAIVYHALLRGQSFRSEPFVHPEADLDFQSAYDWLVGEMEQRCGRRPRGVTYPVWAWYLWDGKKKARPDLRYRRVRDNAIDGDAVLLTLDIGDERVVLSDYDAWHHPLNYWFLGTAAQAAVFEAKCSAVRLSAYEHKPLPHPALHSELIASWRGIFNMDGVPSMLEGTTNPTISIQATFWELHPGDVVDVVGFGRIGKTRKLPPPRAAF